MGCNMRLCNERAFSARRIGESEPLLGVTSACCERFKLSSTHTGDLMDPKKKEDMGYLVSSTMK